MLLRFCDCSVYLVLEIEFIARHNQALHLLLLVYCRISFSTILLSTSIYTIDLLIVSISLRHHDLLKATVSAFVRQPCYVQLFPERALAMEICCASIWYTSNEPIAHTSGHFNTLKVVAARSTHIYTYMHARPVTKITQLSAHHLESPSCLHTGADEHHFHVR